MLLLISNVCHRQEQEQKVTGVVVYLCGLIFIFSEWKHEITLLIL